MKNIRKVFQEVAKGFGTVFTQINNAENLLQNLLGKKVVQKFLQRRIHNFEWSLGEEDEDLSEKFCKSWLKHLVNLHSSRSWVWEEEGSSYFTKNF